MLGAFFSSPPDSPEPEQPTRPALRPAVARNRATLVRLVREEAMGELGGWNKSLQILR